VPHPAHEALALEPVEQAGHHAVEKHGGVAVLPAHPGERLEDLSPGRRRRDTPPRRG